MLLVTKIRLRYEEEMLVEQFGEDYAAYSNTVGGLLPKLPLQVQKQQTRRDHKVHAVWPLHYHATSIRRCSQLRILRTSHSHQPLHLKHIGLGYVRSA